MSSSGESGTKPTSEGEGQERNRERHHDEDERRDQQQPSRLAAEEWALHSVTRAPCGVP
jgi:hypothetical protein